MLTSLSSIRIYARNGLLYWKGKYLRAEGGVIPNPKLKLLDQVSEVMHQELLGHACVVTTQIYTRVMEKLGRLLRIDNGSGGSSA